LIWTSTRVQICRRTLIAAQLSSATRPHTGVCISMFRPMLQIANCCVGMKRSWLVLRPRSNAWRRRSLFARSSCFRPSPSIPNVSNSLFVDTINWGNISWAQRSIGNILLVLEGVNLENLLHVEVGLRPRLPTALLLDRRSAPDDCHGCLHSSQVAMHRFS